MILTLLYHRIGNDKYSNSLQTLDAHLNYIAKCFTAVLPGDELDSCSKTAICLTFDDATIDFYTHIFPLLKKYALKAVLSIPVALINTNGYCSWDMLEEIASNKLIQIASHSFNHIDLTNKNSDLIVECLYSKYLLEKKLKQKILTFVYPFGKQNRNIHKYVKKHYKYIMRIGGSLNLNWQNANRLIYRIPSDNLSHYKDRLSKKSRLKYLIKFFYNTLRLK
jgi:peptidoglycan/xylan/chitin deacetylase (PgdA/CDA1 family)